MDTFLIIVALVIVVSLSGFGLYFLASATYNHYIYTKNPKICYQDRVSITRGFYKGQAGIVHSRLLNEICIVLDSGKKVVILPCRYVEKVEG